MQTKAEDWTVKITRRCDADYSEQIELISFDFSYRGSASSKLELVPFARGTQESDVRVWLTGVPAPLEDSAAAVG